MSSLTDQYTLYVVVSYAATAVVLAGLIWATVAAAARARRELGEVDRRRSE